MIVHRNSRPSCHIHPHLLKSLLRLPLLPKSLKSFLDSQILLFSSLRVSYRIRSSDSIFSYSKPKVLMKKRIGGEAEGGFSLEGSSEKKRRRIWLKKQKKKKERDHLQERSEKTARRRIVGPHVFIGSTWEVKDRTSSREDKNSGRSKKAIGRELTECAKRKKILQACCLECKGNVGEVLFDHPPTTRKRSRWQEAYQPVNYTMQPRESCKKVRGAMLCVGHKLFPLLNMNLQESRRRTGHILQI
ncbi:hypothetical protein VNO77_23722 [Canavalia gladiata]|uniref:Uncharacterized protein n=1 Tax=Canavalia gladiata TaxID=3824 RepID=A0AAN9QBZ1_CANGL